MTRRRGIRFKQRSVVGIEFSNGLHPTGDVALVEHPCEICLHEAVIVDRSRAHLLPSLSIRDPNVMLVTKSLSQNMPFELARGMFGASHGAEFFGSPTGCKVSQCSIAFPSASIL